MRNKYSSPYENEGKGIPFLSWLAIDAEETTQQHFFIFSSPLFLSRQIVTDAYVYRHTETRISLNLYDKFDFFNVIYCHRLFTHTYTHTHTGARARARTHAPFSTARIIEIRIKKDYCGVRVHHHGFFLHFAVVDNFCVTFYWRKEFAHQIVFFNELIHNGKWGRGGGRSIKIKMTQFLPLNMWQLFWNSNVLNFKGIFVHSGQGLNMAFLTTKCVLFESFLRGKENRSSEIYTF